MKDAGTAAEQPQAAAQKPAAANAKPDGGVKLAANDAPPAKAGGQTDDLLYPTEEEARAAGISVNPNPRPAGVPEAPNEGASPAPEAPAEAPSGSGSDNAPAKPQAGGAPVVSIESDVDPESWAEYGGWYRQDYAIFYRPIGHKDKFIYSWLILTGLEAPKGDKTPAAAVFESLIAKDAQGSCTKCHSVDDIRGKGRLVNFSPPKPDMKQGRFTNFIHEPHLSVMKDRGCLTCHDLAKDRPYLKSYEQGNPQNFVSNFSTVKKDLCQTCHTSSAARQDCLTCHKYHVNGVVTPIMSTKLPTQ